MKIPVKAAVVLAVIVCIILVLNFIDEKIAHFLVTDRCFDSGGRWNDEAELCEYE